MVDLEVAEWVAGEEVKVVKAAHLVEVATVEVAQVEACEGAGLVAA